MSQGEVEVVVLGSGDAFHSKGRCSQAIWVRTKSFALLVDCGPTTLYRLQAGGFPFEELDAVLFTHFHGDHFAGIVFLDLALTLVCRRKREIFYGGAPGIRNQFESLYRLCYPGFDPMAGFPRRFGEFADGKPFTLGEMAVLPAAVDHSPSSLGYRIEIGGRSIAVTGDTAWCEALKGLAQGTDLFFCECSHYENAPPGQKHLSHRELASREKDLTSSRVMLLHAGDEVIEHRSDLLFEVADDGTRIVL